MWLQINLYSCFRSHILLQAKRTVSAAMKNERAYSISICRVRRGGMRSFCQGWSWIQKTICSHRLQTDWFLSTFLDLDRKCTLSIQIYRALFNHFFLSSQNTHLFKGQTLTPYLYSVQIGTFEPLSSSWESSDSNNSSCPVDGKWEIKKHLFPQDNVWTTNRCSIRSVCCFSLTVIKSNHSLSPSHKVICLWALTPTAQFFQHIQVLEQK